MAIRIIVDDGNRLLDNNGDPVSGGKLRAVIADSSTPATLYTTPALSVAHADPVVANSAGFLPQMWAPDTASLDVRTYAANDTSYTTPLKEYLDVTGIDSALKALALENGAARVGADDASDGAKYTTIQGFITYLLSSAGSAIVGFVQSGTGAVSRTLQSKLRDTVSPEDFGAVGDGTTDDSAAVKKALESGRVVDGNGRAYALGAPVAPVSLVGVRNCTFKWANTTQMAVQQSLVDIVDLSNWFVDRCTFDMGTVENTGSADDSSRRGLSVRSSSPNVTFLNNVSVTNCTFYGLGNGTRLYVRSCSHGTVAFNTVRDAQVAFSPDPTNDCQNGIDISQCKGMVVLGNRVRDMQTRLSGVLQKRFSRGILVTETRDSTFVGNRVSECDQNFDFSGAVDAVTNTDGNVGLTVTGNTSSDATTYCYKFANVMRDSTISGNTARRFGQAGFVFSGSSTAPYDASKNTQRLLVVGNTAADPTGAFSSNNRGFWIAENAASAGYPRGIKLVGNVVHDNTGGGDLIYGYQNEVTYDGTSGLINEIKDCRSYGHVTAAASGFPAYRCSVRGSSALSLTSGSATDVTWDTDLDDTVAMHDTSTDADKIYARISGRYRITFAGVFAATSSGYRRIRILKNGGAVAGGTFTVAAASGADTTVSGTLEIDMVVGDHVRLEALQNSGGALNLDRANSKFTVELVDIA